VLRLSPTAINSFLWCHKQYWYRYIEKQPMITNASMGRGLYVHSMIEAYLKGESIDVPLPAIQQWDDKDYEWVMDTAQDILDIIKTMYIPVKFTELELSRPLNRNIEIVGKIDLILKNNIIVDFKVLEEMKDTRNPLQLSMYQFLFPEGQGWEYWHFTTQTYKVLSYLREEIESVDWRKVVDDIIKEVDFEKRKNKRWCKKYCSYYNLCIKGGANDLHSKGS